jgi:hypothetical protein
MRKPDPESSSKGSTTGVKRGISRFPCKVLPCAIGASDRAESWRLSR